MSINFGVMLISWDFIWHVFLNLPVDQICDGFWFLNVIDPIFGRKSPLKAHIPQQKLEDEINEYWI